MPTDDLENERALARDVVKSIFGDTPLPSGTDWEAHHLIPVEVFRQFRTQLEQLGIKLNDIDNLIPLASSAEDAYDLNLARHTNHVDQYTNLVRAQLSRILTSPVTDTQKISAITGLKNALREGLAPSLTLETIQVDGVTKVVGVYDPATTVIPDIHLTITDKVAIELADATGQTVDDYVRGRLIHLSETDLTQIDNSKLLKLNSLKALDGVLNKIDTLDPVTQSALRTDLEKVAWELHLQTNAIEQLAVKPALDSIDLGSTAMRQVDQLLDHLSPALKHLGFLGDVLSVITHTEAFRQALIQNDHEDAAYHLGAGIGDLAGGWLGGVLAVALLTAVVGSPAGIAVLGAALIGGYFGAQIGETLLGEGASVLYQTLWGGDDYPFAELFGEGAPFEGQFGSVDPTNMLTTVFNYLAATLPVIGAVAELFELFEEAAGLIDPLVIDLDGDGVTTTSVDVSTAYFDLDNNGVAERAGWIEPEDGFVVHDWSGDGVINNRSEQFATFGELSRHDTNGDGLISAADAAKTKLMDLDGDGLLENVTLGFDSLKVWVDANSDGVTDEGELKTLSELGISSIDLNKTPIAVIDNGNELNAKSTVTFSDGSSADIYGISFNRDTTDTDFSARIAALDLSPEYLAPRIDAFLLPQLAGGGNVPSLLVAALESDDVLNTWRAAADFEVAETEEFMLRVQQLLIDWAGVGDVDPGASDTGNLRHLAAMEAFTGQEFTFGTGGLRGSTLDAGWDSFVAGIGLRIALQTETDFNPGGLISYDPSTDSFAGDFVGFVEHLGGVMFDAAVTSSFDNEGLLRLVNALWQSVSDDLTSAQETAFDAFFEEAFTLYPQSVSSEFFANSKYYDPEHNLSLDPDYEPLKAVSGITHLSGGDKIIHLADVDTDFHDYEGGRDEDKDYDLTLNDAGALMGSVTEFNDDPLDNGQLYYGAGDDYYAGGDGNDTYFVTSSVGYDTIFEDRLYVGNLNDIDLLLVGHSEDETVLTREGDDLFLSWGNSGGIIRVADQFRTDHGIEGIVFGATAGMQAPAVIPFDAAWIEANAWYRGSAGRDALSGTQDDETFHGAEGDDFIDVGTGTDTIVYKSGDGNDFLMGGGNSTTLALENLNPADLFLFIRQETLFIEDVTTGHIITVEDQFNGGGLSAITFSDGESWDRSVIESRAIVVGTEFADELPGADRADTYWGKEGDDVLRGGKNGDIYLFASGDGNDFIHEWVLDSGIDVLKLTDLTLADIYLTCGNSNDGTTDDLFVTIKATGELITIPGQFSGLTAGGVELIEFADGTSIDEAEMAANLTLVGTDQSEILHGSSYGEEIVGGLGDDALYGGAEGDTYVYETGDGSDFIHETVTGSGHDVLKLTDLTLEDVYLSTGNDFDGSQNDLHVTVRSTGEVITVTNQFHPLDEGGVEHIEFADGQLLDSLGMSANMKLVGTDQSETLRGGSFGEQITGGLGDDIMHGGGGSDTYIYLFGDGNDFIFESSGGSNIDVLRFPDLTLSDVEFTLGARNGASDYDLFVTIKPTGEIITISDESFGTAGNGLERIDFADGASVDPDGIAAIATYGGVEASEFFVGGDMIDSLTGTSANETFVGNAGNDSLQGKDGADTYVFGRGDGADIITDDGSGDTDALRISGYTPDEVELTRVGTSYDLVLTFAGTSDQVTIVNTLNNSISDQVEKIVFDDNTVWTMTDVKAMLLASSGTDGADSILGFETADIMTGGIGDDILAGAGGNDTYTYSRGDGYDTLTEQTFGGNGDTLAFIDINPGEVSVYQDGDDITLVIAESTPGAGDAGAVQLSDSASDHFDRGIEKVVFADGTEWTRDDWVSAAVQNAAPLIVDDVITGLIPGTPISISNDELLSNDSDSDTETLSIVGFKNTVGGQLSVGVNDSVTVTLDDSTVPATFEYLVTDGAYVRSATVTVGYVQPDVIDELDPATINGTSGDDLYQLAGGTHTINLGAGADTLIVTSSVGDYTIYDTGTGTGDDDDKIVFATGITLADITAARSGDDVVLSFAGLSGSITIEDFSRNHSSWHQHQIDWFEFSDGTILGHEDFFTQTYFKGTDGNDDIRGTYGADTFTLGLGFDTIQTHRGSDTIVMSDTIGDISLFEWGRSSTDIDDTLVFADGITVDQITGTGVGDDVKLTFAGRSGSITIEEVSRNVSWYLERQIDWFEFSNGTKLSYQDFYAQTYFKGTDGNDEIRGTYGNDTFTLGLGTDTIDTGRGSDTIIMSDSIGDVTLFEWGRSSTDIDDTLAFASGITIDQISVTHQSDDLVLTFDGRSGSITIEEALRNVSWYLERQIDWFEFADGTKLSRTDFLAQTYFAGTDQNDDILGTYGDDVLNGAAGDDALDGGAGNDTFVFSINAGGHDTITGFNAGAGSDDLIEFGTAQFADFASVISAASDDGTDTTITIDAATSVILKSVLVIDLHQDDFQFV